ncbi:HAD-IA family hydrolase [Acetobacteraceae bacterium H6797]|nr:HAD-IA family hydrolase [Acetobacteraceae bacterium H6797]
MAKLAVFDLDGTLVDSVPDIHAALDRLMVLENKPGFSRGEVVPMIGDGIRVLVTRACEARGLTATEERIERFSEDYAAHASDLTIPFAGIPEALEALVARGWTLAVCTNKPEAPARSLLADLGIADRFAAITGGDSLPVRKPDPGHLLGCIAQAGGSPAEAVMIGDHRNDMLAARGAGVKAIFCQWGYGPDSMADGAPLASTPLALLDYLD